MRAGQSEARLLSLNRDTFSRILGSIKQFLKEDYSPATKQPDHRNGPDDCHNASNRFSVDGAFVLPTEDEDVEEGKVPHNLNNMDLGSNNTNAQLKMQDLKTSAISLGANKN